MVYRSVREREVPYSHACTRIVCKTGHEYSASLFGRLGFLAFSFTFERSRSTPEGPAANHLSFSKYHTVNVKEMKKRSFSSLGLSYIPRYSARPGINGALIFQRSCGCRRCINKLRRWEHTLSSIFIDETRSYFFVLYSRIYRWEHLRAIEKTVNKVTVWLPEVYLFSWVIGVQKYRCEIRKTNKEIFCLCTWKFVVNNDPWNWRTKFLEFYAVKKQNWNKSLFCFLFSIRGLVKISFWNLVLVLNYAFSIQMKIQSRFQTLEYTQYIITFVNLCRQKKIAIVYVNAFM